MKPKSFWAEAVNTAAFLINRTPHRMLEYVSPEQMWTKKVPKFKFLRVFGCICFAQIPKQKRRKLDAKSEKCIFVGYSNESKAYRVYNIDKKMVQISRDVEFLENQFYDWVNIDPNQNYDLFDIFSEETVAVVEQRPEIQVELDPIELNECNVEPSADSLVVSSNIQQSVQQSEESEDSYYSDFDDVFGNSNISSDHDADVDYEPHLNVQPDGVLRKSSRIPKPTSFNDFQSYRVDTFSTNIENDPLTVQEAMNSSEAQLWKQAMQSEYNSLLDNNTWELVDLPSDKKAINCKWVFKTKRGADGEIVKHKARLVIKGCAQKRGLDYEDTFSPVVRYNSMRFLFAMAVKHDLEIHQMDAITAFLQGDLEETIYMVQPECFVHNNTKVCRLKKSIYGLKQASRIWNQQLDTQLKKFGMTQSAIDSCIYYNVPKNDSIIIVAVYVDDIIIFSNDKNMTAKLKSNLLSRFHMKDIGEAKFVLGMQIERNQSDGKICLSQAQYIQRILKKFNMEDCNAVATPLDCKQVLSNEMSPKSEDDRNKMENIPYQELIGSLLYAAQVTRPDICYAVNKLSQFNQNPGMAHWNAAKRVLRYLKGTLSVKLEFNKAGCEEIVGYCDSDWASDIDKRRSTTGYVFMLHNCPISWNSKRQSTVALSTTEAEFMSMVAATQEGLWLNKLQCEIFPNSSNQVKLFCDNKSAISLSSTNNYHSRTKHIDVKYNFIKELVFKRKLNPQYIPTNEMVADVLTKPLPKQRHRTCSESMGINFKQLQI